MSQTQFGVSCSLYNYLITSKRVSAKHSVMDDLAFLPEHAIFCYLPNRHPSTNRYKNFAQLIKVGEITKFTKNGWNRLARGGPQIN
jgi:hypothetical protein